MTFTTKTTATETTLINIGIANQILIHSFKVELAGTTANTVTLREGTAGTVIDKFVLTSQGDIKGFINSKAEYQLNSSLTIECSSTSEIYIYYQADLI